MICQARPPGEPVCVENALYSVGTVSAAPGAYCPRHAFRMLAELEEVREARTSSSRPASAATAASP